MMKSAFSILRKKLAYLRIRNPAYHFIHIPKNAGSSVRRVMQQRGDVSLTAPYHYRYIDVVDRYGADLRYFAVVRNPWSRTASRYSFAIQNRDKWPASDPRRQYLATASFADFVRDQKMLSPRNPEKPWMSPFGSWLNQLDWIVDRHGKVSCDCLRLGHLDEDLSAYFGENISIPRKNVTKSSTDYRSMYTDNLIEIVAKTFERDIEYFGFSFESDATRKVIIG